MKFLPTTSAISQRDLAAPALNCGVASVYEFFNVGMRKFAILSDERSFKLLEIFEIAAYLTSDS